MYYLQSLRGLMHNASSSIDVRMNGPEGHALTLGRIASNHGPECRFSQNSCKNIPSKIVMVHKKYEKWSGPMKHLAQVQCGPAHLLRGRNDERRDKNLNIVVPHETYILRTGTDSRR